MKTLYIFISVLADICKAVVTVVVVVLALFLIGLVFKLIDVIWSYMVYAAEFLLGCLICIMNVDCIEDVWGVHISSDGTGSRANLTL